MCQAWRLQGRDRARVNARPAAFPDRGQETEERFNAIGRNAEGRYLFIVFAFRVKDEDALIRLISARYMHQKEVSHYEQRKDF